MRKLYTDVTLETPFMVSYNDGQIQACANDEDTITVGSTEFVRVTDVDGHNVSDGEGYQLLLSDGIIYKLVEGVPESTNISVTDVSPVAQYTFTILPTPADAVCTINGETRTSLTANVNTSIVWSVSKTGYVTETGTHTLIADYTETVTLTPEVQPEPVDYNEANVWYSDLGSSTTTGRDSINQLSTNNNGCSFIEALPSAGTIRADLHIMQNQGANNTVSSCFKNNGNTVLNCEQDLTAASDNSVTWTIDNNSLSSSNTDGYLLITPTNAEFRYVEHDSNVGEDVERSVILDINNPLVVAINNLRSVGDGSNSTKQIATSLTFEHYEDNVMTAMSTNELLVTFYAPYNYNLPSIVGNAYTVSGNDRVLTSTGEGTTYTTNYVATSEIINSSKSGNVTFEYELNNETFNPVSIAVTYSPAAEEEAFFDIDGQLQIDGTKSFYIKATQGCYIDSPYPEISSLGSAKVEVFDASDNSLLGSYSNSNGYASIFINSLRNGDFSLNQSLPNLRASFIADNEVVLRGSSSIVLPVQPDNPEEA